MHGPMNVKFIICTLILPEDGFLYLSQNMLRIYNNKNKILVVNNSFCPPTL